MKIRQLLFAFALSFATISSGIAHAAGNSTLRVATDATFPPFEFVQNGKRTGFDIDLIDAMAKVMHKKVQWIDIDFKGLVPGLVANRFDVAASAIYVTPERSAVVDFTQPYYLGGLAVLVRDNEPSIKTPQDLDGKKVSVQVGTKSVGFLKDNYPKVQRVEVETNEEMFDLLMTNRVDAVVTGKPAAVQFVKSNPTTHVLDKTLTTELYAYAVRKDEAALATQMNQALDTLKENGTYSALVNKWFGPAKPAK